MTERSLSTRRPCVEQSPTRLAARPHMQNLLRLPASQFKFSEDKAGAYGLLGDKAQHEVSTRRPDSPGAGAPREPAPPCPLASAARPRLLGRGAHVQGGRLASRAREDAVGLAPHHGPGADHEEEGQVVDVDGRRRATNQEPPGDVCAWRRPGGPPRGDSRTRMADRLWCLSLIHI